MSSIDQFETEPTAFYSGSYTAQVIFGDLLADGFAPEGNRRGVAVSKIGSDRGEAYFSQAYVPYYIIDKYISGSAAGRAQRFNRVESAEEWFFDSFLPNPIDVHFTSATELAWFDTGAVISQSTERWGIRSVAASVDVEGAGGLFPVWAMTPGGAASQLPASAVDFQWFSRFPFESYYKEVKRLFKFKGQLPETYSASREWLGGTLMTPASSSNIIASFGMGVKGGGSYIVGFGYYRRPGEQYPFNGITDPTQGQFGTVPPQLYYEMFFGIGDGDAQGGVLYRKGPGLITFTGGPVYVRASLLRGFKYGVYNTTPSPTSCVFRHSKFGQFRDMLEQRRYGKFLDTSRGSTATTSPVTVRFVSGTTTYARTIDYVTATNPTYNTRDSGIYDFEYKSGQPFFDG